MDLKIGIPPETRSSGQPFARPGEVNYDLFDRFTLAHVAWGVIMERFGAKATTATAIGIGWELVEDGLKDVLPQAFPFRSKDSFDNRVGDVIGVLAGWGISRLVKQPSKLMG